MHTRESYRMPSRRVDLLKGVDFYCTLLASLGFSTQFIRGKTALTKGQIQYRLRLANVRRTDFRNGESRMSQAVLSQYQPRRFNLNQA